MVDTTCGPLLSLKWSPRLVNLVLRRADSSVFFSSSSFICVCTEKMLDGLIKFALLQVLLAAVSVDNREKIVLQFNSLAQYYKVTNLRMVPISVHLYF